MSFESPGLLWLAAVLPALVAAGLWLWVRRRRRVAQRLGSPDLLARLGAGELGRFPTARLPVLVLAAAAIGVAAGGPRWGLESVEERGSAADLVLALDVSKSMLARDVAPNRLERERVLARRILRELPGDRIGLVAFAGRAYILSPMTVDHGALQLYLDALDPEIVSRGGSSLGAALRQATDLARPEGAGRGAVVLVTDGEALEERDAVLEAAGRAARAGITVHTVGVGTSEGAPVPEQADGEQVESYKRGPQGEVVVSSLDEELLQSVADMTGGRYVRLGEAGATDVLLRTLKGLDRVAGEGRERVREKPRYGWFVLAALLLLVIDGALAGRGVRRSLTEGLHA